MPEAYAFPSDIDLAEKIADTEDTEEDSAKILRSQGKVVRGMLKTEELSGNIEHLNDASLDKVLEKLKSSDLLFVDPNQGEIEMQGITRFKLQELVNKTSIQVEAA
jgi:hypothetical protein